MTSPVVIVDEAALRRILGEELDRRLQRIVVPEPPSGASDLPARDDLAALLRLDIRTLRRLEIDGAIPPAMRIGDRIVRWRRAEIERWLESGGKPFPSRRKAGSCVSDGDRRS